MLKLRMKFECISIIFVTLFLGTVLKTFTIVKGGIGKEMILTLTILSSFKDTCTGDTFCRVGVCSRVGGSLLSRTPLRNTHMTYTLPEVSLQCRQTRSLLSTTSFQGTYTVFVVSEGGLWGPTTCRFTNMSSFWDRHMSYTLSEMGV